MSGGGTAHGGPIREGSVAARLRDACPDAWQAFTGHAFVRQMADGSLPQACYKHFLIQDYLFLRHFARAYALAVYKAEDLSEMRQAAATLDALINQEMRLHVETCAGWGIDEAAMAATPEARANMAYTRFVLETGVSGDLLDLLAALAPCVLGYGEIGARLIADPATRIDGNPYREWIELYGGSDYQEVARDACDQLDRVAGKRIGADVEAGPRWRTLLSTFRAAVGLEEGFWDMGMSPPTG